MFVFTTIVQLNEYETDLGIFSLKFSKRYDSLSAAIKLGTPEPEFLQSGCKLTCSQKAKPLALPKKVANDLKINLAP